MVQVKHNKALMQTALIWSEESYCKRRKVGACISRNGRPISTGFNGTLPGQPNQCEELEKFTTREEMMRYDEHFVATCEHCQGRGTIPFATYGRVIMEDCEECSGVGFLRDTNKTSEFTLHAEYNAIIWANQEGKNLEGCTLHVTLAPCKACSKLIAANGITEVVYKEDYKDMGGVEYLQRVGVSVFKYSE